MIAQQIDHSSKGLFQLNEQAGTAKAMLAIETHYLPDEVKPLAFCKCKPGRVRLGPAQPGSTPPGPVWPGLASPLPGDRLAGPGLARPGPARRPPGLTTRVFSSAKPIRNHYETSTKPSTKPSAKPPAICILRAFVFFQCMDVFEKVISL